MTTTPATHGALDRTQTEAIINAHTCAWLGDVDDQGLCKCGLVVTTEEEWARHTEHAVIHQLWSPTAILITTEAELEGLPMRSTIVARPNRDNALFRRLVFSDPSMHAWCNLMGTFWPTARLLPALVLERGPGQQDAR
ncbi:hypothetical protein P5V34_11525 [Mycobacteroides abscessus subsp. abscessus]|jgi:hypothetical protein|uniref:hypothetical protein n=1 Tax=Mycobacteroides abscessus TaxID=36809 RepID=UPI00266CC347|nr:hypothetical protein [Mycobacteroides abscessus]MDO3014617.1 hypothetical protein [Mycobacteroides abscessus subsp. abscessus]